MNNFDVLGAVPELAKSDFIQDQWLLGLTVWLSVVTIISVALLVRVLWKHEPKRRPDPF